MNCIIECREDVRHWISAYAILEWANVTEWPGIGGKRWADNLHQSNRWRTGSPVTVPLIDHERIAARLSLHLRQHGPNGASRLPKHSENPRHDTGIALHITRGTATSEERHDALVNQPTDGTGDALHKSGDAAKPRDHAQMQALHQSLAIVEQQVPVQRDRPLV